MEILRGFWALVVEVWSQGVLGTSLGDILVAVAIVLLSWLVRKLFAHFVVRRARAWTARSHTKIDDAVVDALEKPLGLVPLALGLFLAGEILQLQGTAETVVESLDKSLIIVVIFWSFYRLVGPLSFLLRGLEAYLGHEIVEWLIKAIKIAFLFVGAAAILETWGIEVGPILAGLGILGVAVALGAQDLFKNLIAGLLVIAEKRFGVGDWIKVEGTVEGTVEKIGFRSTRIRRFDQAPVQVPNTMLSDQAVTNYSAMTHRRIYWTIGVEYRTTVPQLRKIRDQIEAYITDNPAFVDASKVSTFVRIDAFSDSSIDIMLYCFTETTKWGEWLAIKETLAFRIKEIVEEAGTGFAFPSRSLYMESLPADRPEPFVPPEGEAAAKATQA